MCSYLHVQIWRILPNLDLAMAIRRFTSGICPPPASKMAPRYLNPGKVPAVVSLSRAPLHFWSVLLHTFSFLHGCRRDRRLSDMPFLLLEMVTSPSLVSFKVLFSPVDSCTHIASVSCFVWVEFFLGRQSTAYPKITYRRVAAVSSQEVLA